MTSMTNRRLIRRLTPQQKQVFDLLRTTLVNKEIAKRLGVSLGNVKVYCQKIYNRLEVPRAGEARYARRMALIKRFGWKDET